MSDEQTVPGNKGIQAESGKLSWRDALEAAREICARSGFLPMVMLEDRSSEVVLVLNQRNTACYLTTLDGGWPDGTKPDGDDPLVVKLADMEATLQRFHLPLYGWKG
jgi:hypothetical protein